MRISTEIITNPTEMIEIEKDLDAFSNSYSKNPFMLCPFVKYAMQSNSAKNMDPAVLVSKVNENIVGLAPLILKQSLGIRIAAFLLSYPFSPDFVLEDKYREDALENILYVLLKELRCKLITLDLPAESPNLHALERACITNRVKFRKETRRYLNHSVVPVQCSWDDFQKLRGRSFRRRFRKIERNLNNIGKWKITLVENSNDDESTNDTFNKILNVEKMSWKGTFRSRTGQRVDEDLVWLWKSSSSVMKANPDFRRKIYFLDLNDKTVAYSLVIQYKGTAFRPKTSYADQYWRSCIGLCVNNAVVKDLFGKKEVQQIDFMTNLPFHDWWTATRSPRVRFIISKGMVPNLLEHIIEVLATARAYPNQTHARHHP